MASETGIMLEPANKMLIPIHPHIERAIWSFILGFFILFLVINKIIVIITKAKKNLALLICIGFRAGPNLVVPSIVANIVVPAIRDEAKII